MDQKSSEHPAEHPGHAGPRPPAAGRPEGLYGLGFWLIFSATFGYNAVMNLFVLLPLWVHELGGDASMIGLIIGTGSMAGLAVRPLIGAGIDRFGSKLMAVQFLLLDALFILAYIPLRTLRAAAFLVRIAQGAVDGTARVALFAMLYDRLPSGERRGEWMTFFSLCGMLPSALAPMAGEGVIGIGGFRLLFIASTAICLIAALLAANVPAAARPSGRQSSGEGSQASYLALLRSPALLPLWIVVLLFSFSYMARTTFIVPYAYQRSVGSVGWYFAVYSGTGAAARLLAARTIDRIGIRRVMPPSLMVAAVGWGMLAGTGHPPILLIAAIVGGLGHAFYYPSVAALVIGHTESGAMGRSAALYNSLMDLGMMLGPYIAGGIASGLGYAPMFIITAAVSFMGAIYYIATVYWSRAASTAEAS